MRFLLNNLSTAWLVLALIVAPLQAIASPLAPLSDNDCMMMQDHQPGPHTVHVQGDQDPADQAASQCPQCADHGCDDNGCSSNGCFSAHLQLSLPGSLLAFASQPALGIHPGFYPSPASLTPTPLLRPPLV